jgi:putative membrane protein
MMHPGFGIFATAAILHGLLALALLVLLVTLIIWLIRHMASGSGHGDPAEQELRKRYANGEVGRDEYLTRIADLRGHSPPQGSSPQQRSSE